LDFPFVYCNGDSYSDPDYQPDLNGQTYAHVIAELTGGFAMNKARSGSSNKRIMRVTLHDLLQQKTLNPKQPVVALLGLTYELRDEIWIDDRRDLHEAEESHFFRFQIALDVAWRKQLLEGIFYKSNLSTKLANISASHRSFLKKYQEGRAFFYSPYQERISLYMQLYFMIEWCKQHDINILVFCAAPSFEPLEQEYLKDFFGSNLDKRHFLDFEKFSMCEWCRSRGFVPYENNRDIPNGHYRPDAHRAFADYLMSELQQRDLLKGFTACPDT
jgi:hypothetical protein